jgi:hypothetical protein
MKERPILFSRAMVCALLRDIDPKTQTRRVVKPQFEREPVDVVDGVPSWDAPTNYDGEVQMNTTRGKPCPYGAPGDRLWVREAWRVGKPHDTTRPRDILPPLVGRGQGVTVLYEAGGARSVGPAGREEPVYPDDAPMPEWAGKLRPSMFMPRAFSRITLEVTGVRVERLQDISEDDARAEGVESPDIERDDRDWSICPQCGGTRLYDSLGPNLGVMPDTDCMKCDTHAKRYEHLWDSLNAARGYGWDENPWVWVVEFKRVNA